MVSLSGNTGVYLQYAHARVRSILARLGSPASSGEVAQIPPHSLGRWPERSEGRRGLQPAERSLALLLDSFGDVIEEVGDSLEPHRLCGYLYALAQSFTDFYESCPVLRAESPEVREVRALLCSLTADTMRQGLDLLGIASPERL
jgi:arginyl-tRNA synthetase